MASQVERIAESLAKRARDVVRMLALEIDKELRKATPVDTGHARRNWVPSVGQPHSGEVADESAHAAGISEVLGYELADGALWVANGVPYIRRLNYGHSQQSPAGFVERAIDIAMAAVAARRPDSGVSAMRSGFRDALGGAGAENLASAYSPFGDD